MISEIITIDLNFNGIPGAIASYLIRHRDGAVLVESGPGSTIPALKAGLESHQLEIRHISDVFLTHIHLDHAGAAGWLAQQGARIHVHPKGAPHLINPEKLLSSAARIYGDMMKTLWGDFLAVPADRLSVLQDGQMISVGGLEFHAIDTPGHADHHFAYILEDVCFCGDIGGVRMAGTHHIRLPMPPPEFHLEKWRQSVKRLEAERFSRIAPTHFDIFSDPGWHLTAVQNALDEVEAWIEKNMPDDPDVTEINARLARWAEERAIVDGVPPERIKAYESANPTWMSGYGIQRYWRKFREVEATG